VAALPLHVSWSSTSGPSQWADKIALAASELLKEIPRAAPSVEVIEGSGAAPSQGERS
jgi:hypothetical protein